MFVLSSLAPAVGSYGWAIILVTLIIRGLLLPLTLPSIKMASKMRDLQPEIDRLKKQYSQDKMALQQAQVKLFQQHNLNPASGCLPNILQFIILIGLYQVFNRDSTTTHANGHTQIILLDITQAAPLFILPIIAGHTQLILGLMLLPAADTSAEQSLAASTPSKRDDQPAEDMASMAQSMQQQMVFIMPVMTLFLALSFPSGLTLYWVTTTLFSLVQQYAVSGWGGLPLALKKLTRISYGNFRS
jgi:YidC/Oxa1 family membrane protein insertase